MAGKHLPLTDNDKRRQYLFQRYAAHLRLLVEHDLLNYALPYDETYICPVCALPFSKEALDQTIANPLTLEDAPPKSLGGHANVLTCKACNNRAGQQIDHHLTNRMNELDQYQFVPGVEFHPVFGHKGTMVQGTIKVNEQGEAEVIHHIKKNNPSSLNQYIASTSKDDVVNLNFRDSKVDVFRLQLALLKTAYLMVFEKFGYTFLLNSCYDRLREQLRNSAEEIFPVDTWFHAEYYKPYQGVPFVIGNDLESIFPIFILKTGFTERTFAFVIPLPDKTIEELSERLKAMLKEHKVFQAEMDAMTGADYLFDLGAINKMMLWMNNLEQD